MAKRIPVPAELDFLLEKRDAEKDRRKTQRRSGKDARAASTGSDRRKKSERRGKPRRKGER
jgi:hypothetical protein